MKNQYAENIINKMEKQTDKGLNKYGQILEHDKQMPMEKRLLHLQEELIDGTFYVEHLLQKGRDQEVGIGKMVDVIARMMVQIPTIQDENTKEIFLELAKEANGALKEML